MKNGGKKVIIVTLITILGFGTYRISTYVFGASQYHFSFDSKLSEPMQKSIKNAVYESYFNTFASLSDLIQEKCPAVEKVTIEKRANKKIYISAEAQKPYLRIDSQILTKNGELTDTACFISDSIDHLPVIIQKNSFGKATITDEFKQWLLQLDPSVFALYDIVWIDDFSIQLHHKQNTQQIILCSVIATPNESLRDLCQRIIEEKTICMQGTARKYLYIADIRFENQIIICSHKGGAYHG